MLLGAFFGLLNSSSPFCYPVDRNASKGAYPIGPRFHVPGDALRHQILGSPIIGSSDCRSPAYHVPKAFIYCSDLYFKKPSAFTSLYSSLQASKQSLLIIYASVRRPVRAMLVNSQVTEYSVQCSGGPGWKPEYVFGLRNTYHRWRLRFLFADLTALDWRLSLPFTLELSPVEHLGYFECS